jgi:Family of unknown function (DUF5752)
MDKPFHFMTRLNLVELLGWRAKNARELLAGLQEIPGSSIYYHTHRFIQQHHYLSPEPPNDFAHWVTNALGQDALGERLASVDTVKFRSIESLRAAFLDILKSALAERNGRNGDCQEGEEFHFMSCRTFILPTAYEANSLREFREIVKKISIDSIYYHVFEARLRLEKGDNDFSDWFEDLGEMNLARDISRLDPYTMTLEGLRNMIVQKVGEYVRD